MLLYITASSLRYRTCSRQESIYCTFITCLIHVCFVFFFQLHCKNDTIILGADRYADICEWCTVIDESIESAKRDRATLRKDSSHRFPLRRSFLAHLPRRQSRLSERIRRQSVNAAPICHSFITFRMVWSIVYWDESVHAHLIVHRIQLTINDHDYRLHTINIINNSWMLLSKKIPMMWVCAHDRNKHW